MTKRKDKYLFVFGLEPWLLPPAIEMIKVLRGRGYLVDVVYAEYLKKGTYDWTLLAIHPYIISEKNKVKLQYVVSSKVSDLCKSGDHTIVIACDIFALQGLYFSQIPNDIFKVYWAFEIIMSNQLMTY